MSDIQKSDIVYSMTSSPRGFCILINNINFEDNQYEKRNDSIESVLLIKSVFETLNFSANTYFDLKYEDIFLSLNEIINKQECDNHDAIVLYIHSHGNEKGFITSNNKVIEFREIIGLFSDENCKKFTKKPKIIFFDCCRGDNFSFQMDKSKKKSEFYKSNIYKKPSNKCNDLFICYSTSQNNVSMRGWFAQCLSDCLMKYSEVKHFSQIIFEVNKEIQKRYHVLTGHKQSIEYHSIGQNKLKLYFMNSESSQPSKIQVLHEEVIKNKKEVEETQSLLQMLRSTNIRYKFFNSYEIFKRSVFINGNEKVIINCKDEMNLKLLFQFICLFSENYHFKKLIIECEPLHLIEEDILGDISFDEIYIQSCINLKRIHWNAFGKQTVKINIFTAWNNLPNLKSERNTEYDLFKLINSMENCDVITTKSFENEIQPIKLNKLKKLTFNGLNSSVKITSICDYAFYECEQIEEIRLTNNNINYINEQSFSIKNNATRFQHWSLLIDLSWNKLNRKSFLMNWANFKRPVKLILTGNNIGYFPDKIIKQFLTSNQENQIMIDTYSIKNHKQNQETLMRKNTINRFA